MKEILKHMFSPRFSLFDMIALVAIARWIEQSGLDLGLIGIWVLTVLVIAFLSALGARHFKWAATFQSTAPS